jgi:hypothetical protein
MMCGAKRLQHLPGDLDAALYGRSMLEPIAQGFAFHQFGHHIARARRQGSHIVERADMGVIQRGDRAGLALESFAELLRGEFYGYDAVQAGVQTAVDLSHTARAQQADNLVRAKPGAGR